MGASALGTTLRATLRAPLAPLLEGGPHVDQFDAGGHLLARDGRSVLRAESVNVTHSAAVPVTMFVSLYATRGSPGPRKGPCTLALSQ